MASRTITFRFPEEIVEAIETQAKITGKNRTSVMLEALSQAYGFPAAVPTAITTEVLQHQLQELEQRVTHLLSQLNQTMQQVQHRASVAVQVAQSPALIGQEDLLPETRSPSPAQLEHQTRTLEQILLAIPDLVFMHDRMGRFTYLNPAGSRILGVDSSYCLGKTCEELGFSDDVKQQLTTQCERVFTSGRPTTGEISLPTVGSAADYEYILSPIQGESGVIDAVVCTARNITERKQVAEALRDSEEKYRNLFELANDSILIVDASTHRILEANRNAARRLGYTRRELLQISLNDLEPPEAAAYREDEIVPELRKTGGVIYDHVLRCKDNREIAVEISSRLIEYGDRLAVQSFIRDVSKRQEAVERLRLLEAALFNAKDAILIAQIAAGAATPEIIYINSSFAQMTGYQSEEVLGKNPTFLYDFAANSSQIRLLQQANAQAQPVQVELFNSHKDGSEFWVELTIIPISDGNDQNSYWMEVRRNISGLFVTGRN